MLNEIKENAEKRMSKSIASLNHEFTKIRTGRANTSLLDHVMVDYYGNLTQLSQVASITTSDARTLSVTPWDKSIIPVIEKAILSSDLGLNPVTAGQVIRVPMPLLTEERRKELIKVVKAEAEQARVSIRTARREANQLVKDLIKEKSITEDDERRCNDLVQKLTDKYIAEIDLILANKEKDLLEI
ncbi:MAG: ribosome recycling factor [Legionellales bacterium RIFCSPHIGHO2_12_FULL_37_14]|nr:MAG: ribosome recycling factor [Legionellales bacterium RIFCSPHIGHO2_12_FULL_37_14]